MHIREAILIGPGDSEYPLIHLFDSDHKDP